MSPRRDVPCHLQRCRKQGRCRKALSGTGLEHLLEAAANPTLPSCPEDIACQRWPDATVMGSLCLSSIHMSVPCPHVSSPLWLSMTLSGAGALTCLELCLTNVSVSDLFLLNLCPNGIIKIRINREVSRWFLSPPFFLLPSIPGIVLGNVALNSIWERQAGKMCG